MEEGGVAIIYCEKHDILKEFLETHAAEVLNMSLLEWTVEDALSLARAKGIAEANLQTARNALAEGASLEFVQKITGLDMDTIRNLLSST